MRALVILACVLAASATPASTGAPATGTPYTEQSGMPLSPIHYVTPVYDNNYAPTAGAVASAPCAGDCGGAQSTGGLVTPVYDIPSSSNFSSYNEPVKVQAWSGPAPAGQTQGQTVSQSTGPAAPPATPAQQAKKAQINFEIVTIAKMVDGIETHLRNTAAKIDSQQVPSLSALRANLTVAKARLNSEEARVNSTFAAGKITKHRHTVALKAIRFVRSNLRRCFRALRVIEQGRAAVQRNLTAVAARRAVPKPQVQRKPAGRAGAKRRLGPRRRRIVKRQVRRANRAIKKARRAVIGKKGKKGLGKKGGKRRRFVKKQIRRASRAIKKARRVALKKGGKKGGRRLRKGKKGGRRLRKGKKGGRRLRKGKKGARRFRKGKKGGRRVRKAGRGRRRIARRVPKVVQRAKARQFGNETVSLASRVDKLKKRLISDARRVDQNKTAAALTRRDLNEINRMQKAVKVEFARIRGALGRKLITRKTFRREIKALKFLNSELAKCRRAANLVLGDRQRVKQRVVANKIRGAPAATVKAWLFNDTVRLASEIDKVKKFLVDEASRVDSKKPVSAMVRQTISSIETLAKRVADERIRVIEAKRSRKVSLVVAKKAFAAIRLMNAQLTRCRKAARLILADRVKAKAAQSAKTQRKEIVRLNEKAVSLAALVDTIKAALVRDAKLIDAGISGPANKGWLNALQTNITQAEQKLAAERRAVIDDVKKGKITVQYRQRQERALAIMEKQIQRVRKALSVLQRRK